MTSQKMSSSSFQSPGADPVSQQAFGPAMNGVSPAPGPAAPDMELGRILVDEGIVTADEVQRNLPSAEGSPGFLHLLLYCPMISEYELAALLAVRHHVPVLNLEAMDIPQSVLQRIPAQVARELGCLPVASIGPLLCVGVANIRDHALLLRLRAALGGVRVKLFPCEPNQLRCQIARYYPERQQESPGNGNAQSARARPVISQEPGTRGRLRPVSHEDSPTLITPKFQDVAQDHNLPGSRTQAASQRRPNVPSESDSAIRQLEQGLSKIVQEAHAVGPQFVTPPTSFERLADAAPPGSLSPGVEAPGGEMSEEALEALLAQMDDMDESPSGFHCLRAEPVPEAVFQQQWADRDKNETRLWERVHFSHAPLKAEPVTLGFPGSDPFEEDEDPLLHLVN